MKKTKKPKEKIENNLQKYRYFNNITQQQLSEKLRVSVSTICQIEKHKYFPKYITRSKICVFFNISHNQMFIVS